MNPIPDVTPEQSIRLAHVINIFGAPAGSEAQHIQNITLESLTRAKEATGEGVEVELLSAQFAEDRAFVPGHVRATADLDHSVQDDVVCTDKRRLPYIHDILQRAWESTNAEYLVYTNLDISVYPSFYRFLAKSIREGIDALAINRAQIPRYYRGRDLLHDLSLDELLRVRNRTPHHGIDCVLFRREHFPLWKPSGICIGYPPIGQYLLENAEAHANRFVWFKDVYQTFHIGIDGEDTSPWKKLQGNSIWVRNFQEFEQKRIYPQDAWQRHGFTRPKWIMQRAKWLLRGYLPW